MAGNQIPQSDINKVFPELYKFHPNLKNIGVTDVLQYLCSSGLGHLIRKSKFWFLIRNKKHKINQIGQGVSDHSSPWYYIGK